MRKWILLPLAAGALCLFACGEGGKNPSGPSEGGGEQRDPACAIVFELPEFRFGEEGQPLSGSCPCGRPVRFASVDEEILKIEENFALPVGCGKVEVFAFHAGTAAGDELVSRFAEVGRGTYRDVPETLDLVWGEALPAGITLTEPAALEIGRAAYRCLYHPDPARYEPLETEIVITVRRAPAVPPAELPEVSAVYQTGLTAADLGLPANFRWKEPDLLLTAGTHTLPFQYSPDFAHVEPYEGEVAVQVERARREGVPVPGPLSGVYDEAHTLQGMFPLEPGYRWEDGGQCPPAGTRRYPALYNDDPVNYEDYALEIEVTVAPKAAPEVEFPAIPDRMTYCTLSDRVMTPATILRKLEIFDPCFTFVENLELHGGRRYELRLRWQKNENYEFREEKVSVFIEKSADRRPPAPAEVEVWPETENGIRFLVLGPSETARPYELEFSLDGGRSWRPAGERFDGNAVTLFVRFRENDDFLASDFIILDV